MCETRDGSQHTRYVSEHIPSLRGWSVLTAQDQQRYTLPREAKAKAEPEAKAKQSDKAARPKTDATG